MFPDLTSAAAAGEVEFAAGRTLQRPSDDPADAALRTTATVRTLKTKRIAAPAPKYGRVLGRDNVAKYVACADVAGWVLFGE